ncbi:MAG: hypothetical protein VKJ02_15130 [Snowella sp.]|nr:hypothetical protein [Snowella sp.]
MQWIPYILATVVIYFVRLTRLKARTEQERIGSTPVFFNILIFFAIFEFFFLESLLTNLLFHVFGFIVSVILALSMFFYLKSLKKDVELIFHRLVNQSQGRISVLTFMQRTELSQEEAVEFLDNKLQQFPGITYETLGNIYYEYERW